MMNFKLKELRAFDSKQSVALLENENGILHATISAISARGLSIDEEFAGEVDWKSVLETQVELPGDESQSGLYPTDDPGVVLVDGLVDDLLELDPDCWLVTLRVEKNGRAAITFDSEELGSLPGLGARVKVKLMGLTIHPTFV
jgi:hypothetical protein